MFQRVRITYRKTVEASEIQSGQLGHVWIEAFAAAQIELARPEGSRRARLEVAPPLPQEATGEAELLDALLAQPVPTTEICNRLAALLPPGIEPHAVEEIGERLPSLPASVRAAQYRVTFRPGAVEFEDTWVRVASLLAADSIEREELRGERQRRFDLRPLLLNLAVTVEGQAVCLEMRLVLLAQQAGRPWSVLAALGLEAVPHTLVRTAIEVERPLVALRAWRTHGRFE